MGQVNIGYAPAHLDPDRPEGWDLLIEMMFQNGFHSKKRYIDIVYSSCAFGLICGSIGVIYLVIILIGGS